MTKKIISLLLPAIIIFGSLPNSVFAQSSRQEKLRNRVVEWGPNKVVSLKLKSGEKINGRIAEIKDDALTIQMVTNGKILTRDFRWEELNKVSLSGAEHNVRRASGYIALGALATLVVIIGVGLSQLD